MGGPLTITCPSCGQTFVLPVVGIAAAAPDATEVELTVDRAEVYGHLRKCPAFKPMLPQRTPEVDLVGRIHLLLSGGHFMAKGGSRACTMCGLHGDACLAALKAASVPCCGACGEGNTHPAPQENVGTCAEWGAEHGAKD